MIPPEAIEAAAKAVFEVRDDPYDLDDWEDIDSTDRELFTCQARAALEAAAPYLIREARAAELEAAADGWRANIRALGLGTTAPIHWLRARAAAIRDGQS